MKQSIIAFLKEQLHLEHYVIEDFVAEFSETEYKANDYFLKNGQVCKKIAFIVSGAMYCVYNKNGNDRIDEFSFENDFITDYLGFLTGAPADKDIVCLEDCKLLVINKVSLENLYKKDMRFEHLGRLMAEGLFINWHLKAKSLFLDDAETRYFKLVATKPQLNQRVPQYMIASYLNVSPETISRIRKKTSQKLS